MCYIEDFFGGKTRERRRLIKTIKYEIVLGMSKKQVKSYLYKFRIHNDSKNELSYVFRNSYREINNYIIHANEYVVFKFDSSDRLILVLYLRYYCNHYIEYVYLGPEYLEKNIKISTDNEFVCTNNNGGRIIF